MYSLKSLIITLCLCTAAFAATDRQTTVATRLNLPPTIDGNLNDAAWAPLPVLSDFRQYTPRNGAPATERSEVRIGYDDNALYVSAMLYDRAPDSLLTELSQRDGLDDALSDQFALHISPYDDGANSFYFLVSTADVQQDRRFSASGPDNNWDAVWESKARRNNKGWCVEMRIPYAALRFPAKDIQNWGFNVFRLIKRREEWSSWQSVSNERDAWWYEMGRLDGIKNIKPPMRLSFTPYLSTYAEHQSEEDWGSTYRGGLDVKYGITDGFTLDMTLIPDFGQVQSDDRVLNLSPFETYYSERRPFFTEGTELFNKGDLFYSRRIGRRPAGYGNAYAELNSNELITDNPTETRMINATKISGRTNSGLGIGVFNAMTARSEATAKNTINGETRKIETQPFTNYNLTVIDKTLKNNGYLSIINSNVSREGRNANVAATAFRLANRGNSYAVEGQAAVSRIDDSGQVNTGYAYDMEIGKVSGQWQYAYELDILTDKFDKNDLGYMRHNNVIGQQVQLDYNIYKPFGPFRYWYNRLAMSTSRLYNPNAFTDTRFSYEFRTLTKKQWRFNMHAAWVPVEPVDYYEARTPGRKIIFTKFFHNCGGFTTDPRKPLYIRVHGSMNIHYDTQHDRASYFLMAEPYYRISDRLTMGLEHTYSIRKDDLGWVNTSAATGDITFGRRDVTTQTTTAVGMYRFNSRASINIRLRHYHSRADHNNYFLLNENGRLQESDYNSNHNINYNIFNIDTRLTWNFAPGSELVLAWKNEIDSFGQKPDKDYFRNLRNTLDAPQINSLSLKVLYYLDWHALRCK